MKIEEWYSPIKIPYAWRDSRIEKFVYSMSAIWQQSLKLNVKPQIVFVESDVIPTAAADIPQNRILINCDIWSSDSKKRPNPEKSVHETLTTIIGLQIHETLHFIFTKDSKDVLMKRNDLPEDDAALLTIFNIVEDTFIDNQRDYCFPTLSWSYECLFEYFFDFNKIAEMLKSIPEECKTYEDASQFISIMPAFRALPSLFKSSKNKVISELYEMIMSSEKINGVDERVKHSKAIYDFIFKDIKQESQQDSSSKGGGNHSDEKKKFEDDLKRNFKSDMAENIPLPKNAIYVKNDIVSFGGNEGSEICKLIYKPNAGTQQSIFGVLKTSNSFDQKRYSKKYADLGRLIKSKSDTHRYMGEQRDRGSRMRQLHRIITDEKIFSEQIVLKGIGPKEIGILVDLSGSMYDEFVKALESAAAAAISLVNGGHKCFVVGHTADVFMNATTTIPDLIFPIFKELNESIDVMAARMNEFSKFPSMSGNNDDLAILECRKYFTTQRNSKKLIVISDGQPASSRISDSDQGINATKTAVETLRKSGIDVVSLSIKKSAVIPNNRIYGHKKNVANEDVNAVIDLVKVLMVEDL